jgi:hypothetical protein
MGRPPVGKVAMTGAERTRLYRQKHGLDKPKPKPGSAAVLEKQLTAAKAEIAALKDELHAMRTARFAPKPRTPKPEKPPLPPDEERERIIKGLRTRVRNLTQELQHCYHVQMQRLGSMPRQTRIAIDKVLQPDVRGNATEADLDTACKGWNVWKNDSDKARRQK